MVSGARGPRAIARASLAALGGVISGLGAGCTLITDSFLTNEFSGDPFPVGVDVESGAVVVGIREPGGPVRDAVLDVLSPITVIDPGPNIAPSVSYADLTLLGRDAGGSLGIPRAQFPDARLLSLHPCPQDGCAVGEPDAPRSFTGVVGSDVLAGDAIRLRLGDSQVFVLPDIGGDSQRRTFACDGVFGSPFRGGGTLVIAGTELPFGNRRIAVQSCLGFDPSRDLEQPNRGTDALLVMSTGIGVSLLSEAAYQRYRFGHVRSSMTPPPPPLPPLEELPMRTVLLPSGRITGRAATLGALALVANATTNAVSPCRQVYAHHLLLDRNCRLTGAEQDDCPCDNGDSFCPVPAILELASTMEVLVVSDTEPTLHDLRTELRPDQPEVDGVLGTNVLRTAEIDVDYPHDRLVTRCTGAPCVVRPALAEQNTSTRTQVRNCIGPAGQLPATNVQ